MMGAAEANPTKPGDGRRAHTRARLCEASRDVFFAKGFAEATMDEIAQSAGIRRSTLYTHFRDKHEVLAALAEDYGVRASKLYRDLPGPTPSRAQIDSWMLTVAEWTRDERTPTVLFQDLGSAVEVLEPVRRLGDTLLRALAERLPAFRRAVEPGPDQGLALAWASVVLRELCWAALQFSRDSSQGFGRDLLVVAGDLFERFVHEPPGAWRS
jgi:AcrR family transcriptional regulator